MIAARRRRIGAVLSSLARRPARWSRGVDRAANRALERVDPALRRSLHRSRLLLGRTARWAGPRLRPVGARVFGTIAAAERWARRGGAGAARGATRVSAVVTPRRAIGGVVVAAGACLVASQFLDYRAVEIGQPGYAGLPSVARPPTVDVRTAGQAHSYLLVPLGTLAALLGALAVGRDRRRIGLLVAALGL